MNAFGTTTVISTDTRGLEWRSILKSVFKNGQHIERSATDPVVSTGRLCIQQRLSGSLDGHRFVSTTAAVSALRAVTIPPVPGRQTTHTHTGLVDV